MYAFNKTNARTKEKSYTFTLRQIRALSLQLCKTHSRILNVILKCYILGDSIKLALNLNRLLCFNEISRTIAHFEAILSQYR